MAGDLSMPWEFRARWLSIVILDLTLAVAVVVVGRWPELSGRLRARRRSVAVKHRVK
jgi:hypothetical protein